MQLLTVNDYKHALQQELEKFLNPGQVIDPALTRAIQAIDDEYIVVLFQRNIQPATLALHMFNDLDEYLKDPNTTIKLKENIHA